MATPHVRGDFLTDVSQVAEGIRELSGALASAGVAMQIRPGAELGHDMVARLSSGANWPPARSRR